MLDSQVLENWGVLVKEVMPPKEGQLCACHSVAGGGAHTEKRFSLRQNWGLRLRFSCENFKSMFYSPPLPRLPEELGPWKWVEKAVSAVCCCRGCIAPSFSTASSCGHPCGCSSRHTKPQVWVQCLNVARMEWGCFLVPLV